MFRSRNSVHVVRIKYFDIEGSLVIMSQLNSMTRIPPGILDNAPEATTSEIIQIWTVVPSFPCREFRFDPSIAVPPSFIIFTLPKLIISSFSL